MLKPVIFRNEASTKNAVILQVSHPLGWSTKDYMCNWHDDISLPERKTTPFFVEFQIYVSQFQIVQTCASIFQNCATWVTSSNSCM